MSRPDSIFIATSDGCVMLASGTLVPLNLTPFTIGIPDFSSPDESLRVEITLERDEKDPKSRSELRGDPQDSKLIHLRIVNLESPLGGGPDNALELWRSPSDIILLQLRIYTQGSSPPTVHFSFYSKPTKAAE